MIVAQPEDQYDAIDNIVSDPVVAAVEPDEDDTYDVMPEVNPESYENWKTPEVVRTTHSSAAPSSVRCPVAPRRRRHAAPFSDYGIY